MSRPIPPPDTIHGYPGDLLARAADALADRAGLGGEELRAYRDLLLEDAAAVLDAVDYGNQARRYDISQAIGDHAINAKAARDIEVRQLRAQTARDAATIKKLQDMSVARLASHELVVETLQMEIRAMRQYMPTMPTEEELTAAALVDGFSVTTTNTTMVRNIGSDPIPSQDFQTWWRSAL